MSLTFLFPVLSSVFHTVFFLTRPHVINKGYCISCRVTVWSFSLSLCLSAVDMVDTQQLLAWPVGFSLNTVDLSELDDSTHSFDMKHLSTLDYASLSSSSVQSSMSPSLAPCISPTDVTYNPSPPQRDEHLTNMDYTNLHSYRTETIMHSKSSSADAVIVVFSLCIIC